MNYELLCEILLEVLQEYRTQLQKLQSGFGHTNSQVEILQSINNGLQLDCEKLQEHNKELDKQLYESQSEKAELQLYCNSLQEEKTNLLLHRNSLQAENNKLILERDELKTDLKEQIDAGIWLKHECDKIRKDRDQMWNNWQLALNVVADLQLKNDEKRQLLKERGVIIDDSIVREEPK